MLNQFTPREPVWSCLSLIINFCPSVTLLRANVVVSSIVYVNVEAVLKSNVAVEAPDPEISGVKIPEVVVVPTVMLLVVVAP